MSGAIVRRLGAPEALANRFLIACMIISFAALLAAGGAATWATMRNAQHTRWVNHTYDVEVAIGRAVALIERTEATRRGYLLTAQPDYLVAHRESRRQAGLAIDRVAMLTADNARQAERLVRLRRLLAGVNAAQDTTVALVEQGQRITAADAFARASVSRRMSYVRAVLDEMTADERGLLVQRDSAQRQSELTFYTVLALAALLILVVAIVSLATVMRYMRDLDASRGALRVLNTDLEGAVAVRTADLTRANEEIQRFAYIVSHDLRSPLVNVMGFTAELDAATRSLGELIDRAEAVDPDIVTAEARLAARQDLPEAIGFIRTSTQKMDRLINAILQLSREGRRVLLPERLVLAEIAANVRDSLFQLAADRGAEIVIAPSLPILVSDRLAVEQILSNLVENAIKYLKPGRPGRVVISGRSEGQRHIVEVADNGRGIDPRDHGRIFDLFRRSGAQDQAGEGIGLAHVRALAYRLGGFVDVASTLGEGATFRLSLPAELNLAQEPTA
ncbi:ATP-binding protein [uncultured Sphingomonas sp.]|uniref:sensor histidine kinase n=1 Tax=uncultured Sphingomonas sp. TaxID=158754 RepID=UPI0035CB4DBE